MKGFLPYQRRWLQDDSRIKIWEKSRRIGATFTQAYEDVRDCVAGRYPAVWFTSADESAAEEYILYCARFARAFNQATSKKHGIEIVREDDIQVLRITFSNGSRIVGMNSNPARFRSKGGKVVIDEFAHHKDAAALWTAAEPVSTWGFPIRILSTHRGRHTQFWRLCATASAATPKKNFAKIRAQYYQPNALTPDNIKHDRPTPYASSHNAPFIHAHSYQTHENNLETPENHLESLENHLEASKRCVIYLKTHENNLETPENHLETLENHLEASKRCVIYLKTHGNNLETPENHLETSKRCVIYSKPFENQFKTDTTEQPAISHHITTIYDAIEDGLLNKILNQSVITVLERDSWIENKRASCFDEFVWLQEYCCHAVDSASAFITLEKIDRAKSSSCLIPFHQLANIPKHKLYAGFDVARKHDLSVLWIIEWNGTKAITRYVETFHNKTFNEQEQRLHKVIPLCNQLAIDKTGIGFGLCENLQRFYHTHHVRGVSFTNDVKEHLAFRVRAMFDDEKIEIPTDDQTIKDIHSVERSTTRTGKISISGSTTESHADRFWALALAIDCIPEQLPEYNERAVLHSFAQPKTIDQRRYE